MAANSGLSYRYLLYVIEQHFDGRLRVELDEHSDLVVDRVKQVVLVDQSEHVLVLQPAAARENNILPASTDLSIYQLFIPYGYVL